MSNDLNPGNVCDFSMDHKNHIAKVEIGMKLPAEIGGVQFYICRRINNGSLVLAREEDLRPENQKS